MTKSDDYESQIKKLYLKIPQEQIADAIFSRSDFKDSLVIPISIDWADLGTWKSVYDFFSKNKKEYEQNPPKNFSLKNKRCLILNNTDQVITTKRLKNTIIVNTQNGTLISHKNELSKIDPYLKEFGSGSKSIEINNLNCEIDNQTDKPILTAGLRNITIRQTLEGLFIIKNKNPNKN
jgi:hypothetical protein